MARQAGNIRIIGTVEGLCFYRMQSDYFVRRKSSLSGKRFRADKVFAGSRRSCSQMAEASPLASRLYHRLPQAKKGRAVFQKLTGQVKLLLKEGWMKAQVEHWFEQTWLAAAPVAVATPGKANRKRPTRSSFAARQGWKAPPPVWLPLPVKTSFPTSKNPTCRCRLQVRERGSPCNTARVRDGLFFRLQAPGSRYSAVKGLSMKTWAKEKQFRFVTER